MCTDDASYSTICGPRDSIEHLIELWPHLQTAERFGLGEYRPTLIDVARLETDAARRFLDRRSPAVAVVEHEVGDGISVASQLQAELMVGSDHVPYLPDVLCEPGYRFQSVQVGAGPGIPQFLAGKLAQIAASVPRVPPGLSAQGTRLALLDTGLQAPGNPAIMIDFTDSARRGVRGPGPTTDEHGHGSAMAEIVQTVNRAAKICPVRVLDDRGKGESYEVLAGLQYALYSGEFDCVSASLRSPASSVCASSLGRSLDWTLAYCKKHGISASIPVIAAAGNDGNAVPSSYPAKLSTAVVVLAVDSLNQRTSYNCAPPAQATTMEAYGGDQGDTLGDLLYSDGTRTPMYGTSYATAAIAGAFLT